MSGLPPVATVATTSQIGSFVPKPDVNPRHKSTQEVRFRETQVSLSSRNEGSPAPSPDHEKHDEQYYSDGRAQRKSQHSPSEPFLG
jgi:hypothetical protein